MGFFMKSKNAITVLERRPIIRMTECGDEVRGMSYVCYGGDSERAWTAFLDKIAKYSKVGNDGQRLVGVFYVNNVPFECHILDGGKLFADLRRMPPNVQSSGTRDQPA